LKKSQGEKVSGDGKNSEQELDRMSKQIQQAMNRI
jgi:hypothetical protein